MNLVSTNRVYETALAYQRTAALVAATKLDLFTILGTQALDAAALAAASKASVRGVRMLCDYLVVIGLLSKADGRYRLTDESRRFLDRTSADTIADSIDFLAAPDMISLLLDDPVSYVVDGGSKGMAHVAPDHPIWAQFAKAMVPFAALTAKRVAAYVSSRDLQPKNVLDVAAGHGLYGIEIARAVPSARVTAIDWATVLPTASANAENAGVGERYATLPGSAFDVDWGTDRDLILLPNLLHHFGEDDCVRLLKKALAALSPGGQALVIDFVPGPDRISPPDAAMFAFRMLATTPQGDAYTLEEIERMARAAGFMDVTGRALSPTPQTLVVLET